MRHLKTIGIILVLLALATQDPISALRAAAVDTQPGLELSETWVTAPSGAKLYMRILQPTQGENLPAVILVPGGLGAGAPMINHPEYPRLAADGYVVVAFNAEGRGDNRPGNLRSEGTEDCNGFRHQDGVKAVIEYIASSPFVNRENIGMATFSYGITMGAGTLGRYPNLWVKYLIDGEGPHDNRVTTFQETGREGALCGHRSLVSDPSPQNESWWAEREAVRFIGRFKGAYMRVQAQCDHAQPCDFFRHAIEMNNAAVQGGVPWVRINGSDLGNPIGQVYPLNDPSRYPKWVPGKLPQQPGGSEGVMARYIREMASAAPAAIDSEKQAGTIYFQIALNINYASDSTEQQQILQVVRRHLDLMNKYGTKANYYFTGLAAEMVQKLYPALVEQLKSSQSITLNHHGANRPPRPMPIDRVKGQNWEEDVKAIVDYESCALDPATGRLDCSRPGGLKNMTETIFKQTLLSTGRFFQASILHATKQFGVKMAVGLQDNTGAPRGDAWFLGVLNRPDGVAIGPELVVRWALGGSSPLRDLEQRVAALDKSRIRLISLLVHDNDFYRGRTAAQAEQVWQKYAEVVQWALARGYSVVSLEDLYGMAIDDRERTITMSELQRIAEHYAQQVEASTQHYPPDYIDLGSDYFSLSDAWQALAQALAHYQQKGSLPDQVIAPDTLGPTAVVTLGTATRNISADDVLRSAVNSLVSSVDRVPAAVRLEQAGIEVNASEHLYLMAKEFLSLRSGSLAPVEVFAIKAISKNVEAIRTDPNDPRNGQADALTKLQFWTFKPGRWK